MYMDKTNVKVEFIITGEEFNVTEISDLLKLIPSKSWDKGDDIPGKSIKRVETIWMIETEYEESLDINEQLSKILDSILDKKLILKEIKTKYSLEYVFAIVINVENNEKPSMYFNHDFIEFASEIKAEFYVDLYIYS